MELSSSGTVVRVGPPLGQASALRRSGGTSAIARNQPSARVATTGQGKMGYLGGFCVADGFAGMEN